MTRTAENPYTATRDCFGRPEQYFDLGAFGTALAAALGVPIDIQEPGRYPIVRINCSDRLTITVSAQHGAKAGRVRIGAWAEGESDLDHHERAKLGSITVDSARPIDAIARDVKRRIIEPAAPLLAASTEKIAAKRNEIAQLQENAARLMSEIPLLRIQQRDKAATTAPIYYNSHGCYLTGTLYASGKISFDRVSVDTAEQAEALLRLVTAKP